MLPFSNMLRHVSVSRSMHVALSLQSLSSLISTDSGLHAHDVTMAMLRMAVVGCYILSIHVSPMTKHQLGHLLVSILGMARCHCRGS